MHLETIIIAISATVAITVQYIFHAMERKDLYNRIMSKDLREYQEGAGERQPSKPSKGNPIKRTLDKQYDLKER